MADVTTPTRLRRVLTTVGNVTVTLGVVGASAAAIVFAVGFLGDRAAAVPDPEGATPVPVNVASIRMEEHYTLPRRFIGQVEARTTVALSFELGGRIDELLVEEGDKVNAGSLIARLDTELLEAEARRLNASRAATAAQLDFAESRLQRAKQLQKQGFTSTETLDQALAARNELSNRIAEMDAALEAVKINIAKSELYAPVTGQIATQSVDAAETISAGQELITMIETSVPELRVGLPIDLDAAQLTEVKVDIDGTIVPAKLKSLRPDIDPVTRTRTGLFTLETDLPVLIGRTAALLLETEIPAIGAWVPADALQSGEGSVWRLLIVDDGRLGTVAVEIQHVENDRAYVRGTFVEGTQIVTSGAHRVVAGQAVTVIEE